MDGTIRIFAELVDSESFVVRVQKKQQRRKVALKVINVPRPIAPRPKQTSEVYIVQVESPKNVCGSNEEGEIDDVDILAVFKGSDAASEFLQARVEADFGGEEECEFEEGYDSDRLLWRQVLKLCEGSLWNYNVMNQRLR